jgi:hypothetical protein
VTWRLGVREVVFELRWARKGPGPTHQEGSGSAPGAGWAGFWHVTFMRVKVGGLGLSFPFRGGAKTVSALLLLAE